MEKSFNFNISLSVLNHLGRNLYRSIITILGEAISNSWDADADNVIIELNKKKNRMVVVDDGDGMDENDFQNKFLKIGFSKRNGGNNLSKKGRPYIGRKGIGKLALLSCAKKITIVTKKNGKIVGGCIDNEKLDKAIVDDVNSQDYKLENYTKDYEKYLINIKHGTAIIFDDISINIKNTEEYLKKSIALYFRFSLIDKKFNIIFNKEKVTVNDIQELANSTQFVWNINDTKDPFVKEMKNIRKAIKVKSKLKIKGFIATTEKPSQLKIRGTDEKVGIDVFVNGRVREKDILKHKPTSRVVEAYSYGQIFYDKLDKKGMKDIFTSSREGIVYDSEDYLELLNEIERIYKKILDDWDENRREILEDGDIDNEVLTKSERKAQELFNVEFKSYGIKTKNRENSIIEKWILKLQRESQFNIPAYATCYISENIIRKYIENKKMKLTKEAQVSAEKWKGKEKTNKGKANITYDLRQSNNDIYYLDMDDLSNMVDKVYEKDTKAGLSRTAIVYKPIRDAVCHTSLITENAKSSLKLSFENIKARIKEIFNNQ